MQNKQKAKPLVSSSMLGQRRGQFYLITAVIMATIIIGIATISNYAKNNSNTRIYDLQEELQIESAKVVDYGTNQGYDDTQMKNLLTNYSESYINYSLKGNGYFLFGTRSNVKLVAYQEADRGERVSFDKGDGETSLSITPGEIFSQEFTPTGTTVKIKINSFDYSFELSAGENFYFALSQKSDSGTFIVTG